MRDPYEVLGVSRSATDAEVRTQFRKLAALYHPDKNPGDESQVEHFKELNAAHQILSDPDKRAAWDRFGEAAFRPGGGAATGGPFVDFSVGFEGVFGDILGAFGIRAQDKNVVRVKLRVSFDEAALGTEKEIHYQRVDVCDPCKGSGASPGTDVSTCVACNGKGRVKFQQALFPIAVERACSRCRGLGKIPASPCKACAGAGLGKKSATSKVTIPAGIESGASRSIEGAGNRTSPNGAAGSVEVPGRGRLAHLLSPGRRRHLLPRTDFLRPGLTRRGSRGSHARGQGEAPDPELHTARKRAADPR